MNQQDKIHALATGVMGWQYSSDMLFWIDEDRFVQFPTTAFVDPCGGLVEFWNPYENWDHAGMVLDKLVETGLCPALVYDDNGHWALASEGMQNCPMGDEPEDIATTFFIEAKDWHDDPKTAICEAALATQGD